MQMGKKHGWTDAIFFIIHVNMLKVLRNLLSKVQQNQNAVLLLDEFIMLEPASPCILYTVWRLALQTKLLNSHINTGEH